MDRARRDLAAADVDHDGGAWSRSSGPRPDVRARAPGSGESPRSTHRSCAPALNCRDVGLSRPFHFGRSEMALSRRQFFKLSASGIGAASLAPLGCLASAPESEPAGAESSGPLHPLPMSHDDLDVVTLNIKFGRRVDRARQLFARVDELARAHIVLLQEMDAKGTEALASALRMSHVYHRATVHAKTGRDFGNAVLARWPMVRRSEARAAALEPSRWVTTRRDLRHRRDAYQDDRGLQPAPRDSFRASRERQARAGPRRAEPPARRAPRRHGWRLQ